MLPWSRVKLPHAQSLGTVLGGLSPRSEDIPLIVGIGIDLVEIERIERMAARHGDAFLRKVFTPEEIAFCSGKNRPGQHYAARFAAKEAALKALGTGVQRGRGFKDVWVERAEQEAPRLVMRGGVQGKADKLGIKAMHVSLTHTDRYAAAYVVAEG